MRLLSILLVVLLIVIQYPLWLGKGGWLRVWDLDRQVTAAQQKNEELKDRNDRLASEVRDLKEVRDAVEERASYELGMLKEGEVFVQVIDPGKTAAKEAAPKAP